MSATVVLIHGGLWDAMDADQFWRTTGIAAGLTSYGVTVVAPDRPKRATGWDAVVDARTRAGLLDRGCTAEVVDGLLAGGRCAG